MNAAIACIGFALAAPAAWAGPAPRGASASPPASPMGLSVGSPTEGHLVGGAHLGDAPYLRVVPAYAGGDVRWGIGAMIGMLDRSARTVRRQFPDAVMSLGHISRQGGGELDRHASHESGRDADVQFYVRNEHGKPVYTDHFVPFRGDGTALAWAGARFDDARNWALVSAFLNDPVARVSHIFVATPIRARLLAYAAHAGVSQGLRDRAALTMVQPHGSLPHDDHFHVRISCPSGMQGCIENPTGSRIARAKRHGLKLPVVGAPPHHALPPPVHHVVAPAPVAPRPAPDRAAAHAESAAPPPADATPEISPDFAPPAMMVDEIDDADGN
jgi:penicillin-insensitive murein endopeptidase